MIAYKDKCCSAILGMESTYVAYNLYVCSTIKIILHSFLEKNIKKLKLKRITNFATKIVVAVCRLSNAGVRCQRCDFDDQFVICYLLSPH